MSSKETKDHYINPFELITLLKTVKQRYKHILLITAVGVLSTIIYLFTLKPYYQKTLYVKSHVIEKNNIGLVLEELQSLNNENVNNISQTLDIPDSTASKFKHFKYNAEGDDIIRFKIAALEPEASSKINKQILLYLNSLDFVVQRERERRKNLNKILDKIHKETKEMEKIKETIRLKLKNRNVPSTGSPPMIYPHDIHFKLIDLKKEELEIQEKLEYKKPFEVIQTRNNQQPYKKIRPQYIRLFLLGTIVSFLVGLSIILIWEYTILPLKNL